MSQEKLILQSNMLNAIHSVLPFIHSCSKANFFCLHKRTSESRVSFEVDRVSVLVQLQMRSFYQHKLTLNLPPDSNVDVFVAQPSMEGVSKSKIRLSVLSHILERRTSFITAHTKSLIENGNFFHDKLFIPLRRKSWSDEKLDKKISTRLLKSRSASLK